MKEHIPKKKKILGSGMTSLIISNQEIDAIMKIVKYFNDFASLIKCARETIKHEAKEQKGGFLSILLATLGAILLGNLLTGKYQKLKYLDEELQE